MNLPQINNRPQRSVDTAPLRVQAATKLDPSVAGQSKGRESAHCASGCAVEQIHRQFEQRLSHIRNVNVSFHASSVDFGREMHSEQFESPAIPQATSSSSPSPVSHVRQKETDQEAKGDCVSSRFHVFSSQIGRWCGGWLVCVCDR